ncbi:MAG TPA: hypothetical protein PLW39_11360, partial [Thermoflexales bacterium]|nr:hypothetical protein [Thermoflexales bacterium]
RRGHAKSTIRRNQLLFAEKNRMDNNEAPQATNVKKPSKLKYIALGGCLTLLIVVIICGVAYAAIVGVGNNAASLPVAEKNTLDFIHSIQNDDAKTVISKMSSQTLSQVNETDLTTALMQLKSMTPISKFQSLKVCEWGVIGEVGGARGMSSAGLISYDGGTIRFISNLRQDAPDNWRVFGFFLRSDLPNTPWGACQ